MREKNKLYEIVLLSFIITCCIEPPEKKYEMENMEKSISMQMRFCTHIKWNKAQWRAKYALVYVGPECAYTKKNPLNKYWMNQWIEWKKKKISWKCISKWQK